MLCGELGTGRDVSEKQPPALVEGCLAGKEHRSHLQERPSLFSRGEDESKGSGLSGKLDLTVYQRILRANSSKWNGKEADAHGSHLL